MTTTNEKPDKRRPLDDLSRARVARLIDELGETGAAERLGIARTTAVRASAGRPLHQGTAMLITERLKEVG